MKSAEEKANEPEAEEQSSLKDSLKDLVQNPVAFWATLGASCRFINMLACDYFFPAFMLLAYPGNKTQFATLSAICVAGMGFLSSVIGGIAAEKYGPKNNKAYARICQIGSLLAWPCFTICTLTTGNFWLSIVMLFGKYIFGEGFWSANLAMIQ